MVGKESIIVSIFVHDGIFPSRTIILQGWVSSVVCPQI